MHLHKFVSLQDKWHRSWLFWEALWGLGASSKAFSFSASSSRSLSGKTLLLDSIHCIVVEHLNLKPSPTLYTAFDHSPLAPLAWVASFLPPPSPVNLPQAPQSLFPSCCLFLSQCRLLLFVSFGTSWAAGVCCSQLQMALKCGTTLFLAGTVSVFTGAVNADHLPPGHHSWMPGVTVPVCRPLPQATTTF